MINCSLRKALHAQPINQFPLFLAFEWGVRLATVLLAHHFVPECLSRTVPGCVTCHTRHASVTHFRPILGNIVEVTLVTSPNLYINSHTKGTGFPLVRITIMIPP